jgi:hypothetical protein
MGHPASPARIIRNSADLLDVLVAVRWDRQIFSKVSNIEQARRRPDISIASSGLQHQKPNDLVEPLAARMDYPKQLFANETA